jgi:hypothetical protein
MGSSTSKLQRELRALEARRRTVVRRLLSTAELAVGTVSWVDRKCGRAGCHCARGEGHRQMQFLFADPEGVRRCKLVRKADQTRLEEANERYRACRDDLRELGAIQKRQHEIQVALIEARGLRYE